VSDLDFVPIPAGPFAFGEDPAALYPPDEDETPRRVVHVEGFLISRVPVCDSDGVPLTYVSRDDAEAFCAAHGVRLPTELEWEAAARGGDDRLWPWGDELPDRTRATFGQGIGKPSPAGRHPAGASPCGALDLAGNVWEWTAEGLARGGSYLSGPDELRCSARFPVHPAVRDPYIGFRVVAVEPTRTFGWVEVPSGDYVIGRDPEETRQRFVEVDAFELTRTPITNAQYGRFVAEAGVPAPPHRPAPDDHPVTFVDWHEASAFCAWAGGRLPTEAEWEKAARGTDGRTYPWGDEEDDALAAVGAGMKHGAPAPVGSHQDGASPYGLLDMAGNVWEWTSTEYPPGERVLRGGSFASPGLAWARCTMRSHSRPVRRQAHIGFRVARGSS
jgi:formylglycine-generating enzyme required for sulfatase activity